MKATITIRMDNEAFAKDPGTELARILRSMARQCEIDLSPKAAIDYDGLTVGLLTITT